MVGGRHKERPAQGTCIWRRFEGGVRKGADAVLGFPWRGWANVEARLAFRGRRPDRGRILGTEIGVFGGFGDWGLEMHHNTTPCNLLSLRLSLKTLT